MSAVIPAEPITAAQCSAEWIAVRREMIQRVGYPLRAGQGHTIEIKSLTSIDELMPVWDPLRKNQWGPIALPNGAQAFTTAADRDQVLAALIAK